MGFTIISFILKMLQTYTSTCNFQSYNITHEYYLGPTIKIILNKFITILFIL